MTGLAASPPRTAGAIPGAADQVRTLLDGHGLAGEACAVAYLSFSDPESCIAAYGRDGRLTPLIGFLPLPMRGAALCQAISAIDENGPRLLFNFRRAFPEDAERLAVFEADVGVEDTAAPGWLFAACSLALGLEQRDVRAALRPAIEAVGLDTFVIEAGERYVLDGRRLLRSLMSYRIGGVAKHVLARSIFESLGHFTADAIGRLLQQWKAGGIVLAGDLFERNVILRQRALTALARSPVPVVCAGAEGMPPGAVRPQVPTRPGPGPGREGRGPVPIRLVAKDVAWRVGGTAGRS